MDFFLICSFWWDISPSQSDYGFQLPWFFLKWLQLDVTSLCGKSGLFLLFFVGLCGLLLLCLSCLWVAVWWAQTLLVEWVWKWPRIPRQSIWDLMIFPQEETNQLSMIPFLGCHLPFSSQSKLAMKTTVTSGFLVHWIGVSCSAPLCQHFREVLYFLLFRKHAFLRETAEVSGGTDGLRLVPSHPSTSKSLLFWEDPTSKQGIVQMCLYKCLGESWTMTWIFKRW